MLKFRLLGYPVRVEWMFWVLCALLGLGAMQTPGPDGLLLLAVWVSSLFISILWHELGHAQARKKFGQPYSEIVLHGIGGYCVGPGQFTRKQSMMISAAGPAATILLALGFYLLSHTPGVGQNFWLRHFVSTMWILNAFLAVINLLPILPMDGGRIFEAYMANRNPSIVPKVGFLLAHALAVLCLLTNHWFGTFLMAFKAYENWQRMQQRGIRF